MPDETDVAQRDSITTIIEGARRRSPDIPPRDDTANKFPTMFDFNTFTVLAGPVWVDCHMSSSFKIRSVRVDNGTNQWLQMGPNADYIPPFTYGVVFNVRGQGSIEIFRAVPLNSGVTQLAPVAGQSYSVTVYDKPQYPFNFSAQLATGFKLGAQPIVTTLAAAAIGAGGRVITVPATGPAWQITAISGTLTATATVGNRQIAIDFKDAAGVIFLTIVDTTVIAATVARGYWATPGGPAGVTTVIASMDYLALPTPIVVPAGGSITVREFPVVDAADTVSVELVALPYGV